MKITGEKFVFSKYEDFKTTAKRDTLAKIFSWLFFEIIWSSYSVKDCDQVLNIFKNH